MANINIREVGGGDADILIDYKRRDHYDGSPFDGRGKHRVFSKIRESNVLKLPTKL